MNKPRESLPSGKSRGTEGRDLIHDPKLLAVVITLLAGTALLVGKVVEKACEGEKDEQKLENPTPPEEGRTKTLRDDLPGTLYYQSPDSTTGDAAIRDASASDGGTPPDDIQEEPELTLEEACQNLIDAQDGDEEGAIYQALSDITRILEQQDQEMSIYKLDKIADACKITQKQMMAVLKTAIEQGNHKIAELVKHLIYEKCRAEEV